MTVSSLVFPSFLSNANYENKKVTFKAMLPSSEKTESADGQRDEDEAQDRRTRLQLQGSGHPEFPGKRTPREGFRVFPRP